MTKKCRDQRGPGMVRFITRRFDVNEIRDSGSRVLNESVVERLRESILALGVLQPIAVHITFDEEDNEVPNLVWGAHRLEALRRIDPEQTIQVYDVSELTPAERVHAERDENIKCAFPTERTVELSGSEHRQVSAAHDDVDGALRSLTWATKFTGDADVTAKLEEARGMLPAGDDDGWRRFGPALYAVISAVFPAVGPKDRKFLFALELDAMCAAAVNDNYTLPADVAEAYAEYGRKPQKGKLGNRPYVAGAFAIARGYHSGPLEAAKQWIVDREVLEFGERAGLRFPGIAKRKTRG